MKTSTKVPQYVQFGKEGDGYFVWNFQVYCWECWLAVEEAIDATGPIWNVTTHTFGLLPGTTCFRCNVLLKS